MPSLKTGMDFRGQVWKRVWHVLIWNRVRMWRTGRHTPNKNSLEYPPPPGWSVSGHSFLEISLCPVLSDTWMGKYSTFHPKHPKWDQNLQFKPKRETKSITVTFMWVPPVFSGLLTGKNISSCWSLFQLGIQKLASKNVPPGPYVQIGQHIKLYTTSTLNSITEFNIQSVLRSRIAQFPVKTCI